MNAVMDDAGKLQSCVYETSTASMRAIRDPSHGVVLEAIEYNGRGGVVDIGWFQQFISDMSDILYAARVDFGVPKTAKEKLHYLIFEIGPGFHPDNRIEDYVTEDGEQTFIGTELQLFSDYLADCWNEFGTQIYNVGLELYQSMFPKDGYKKPE